MYIIFEGVCGRRLVRYLSLRVFHLSYEASCCWEIDYARHDKYRKLMEASSTGYSCEYLIPNYINSGWYCECT